ncbi:Protein of unknown function [Cotesia congregata]|uniref:Uncharacterized protein n=1 Tax=Cotesia congregata TaxID=51543 RepID=A0A8J2HBL6_COTCN|nr:Protein of unknown function [Cotesia congregata]
MPGTFIYGNYIANNGTESSKKRRAEREQRELEEKRKREQEAREKEREKSEAQDREKREREEREKRECEEREERERVERETREREERELRDRLRHEITEQVRREIEARRVPNQEIVGPETDQEVQTRRERERREREQREQEERETRERLRREITEQVLRGIELNRQSNLAAQNPGMIVPAALPRENDEFRTRDLVRKWGVTFNGERDVLDFLERIDELTESYGFQKDKLVHCIPMLLREKAIPHF